MLKYTVYSAVTGEILRTGQCQEEAFLLQAGEGEACLQGEFDAELFYMVDGMLVEYPPKPYRFSKFDFITKQWIDPRPISTLKQEAMKTLLRWVEQQRQAYVTPLPGQEMIYLAKEAEALRYLNDPEPDLLNYPFISREIGITGDTGWQVAQVWAYMANLWRETAAQLEQTRLGLGAQIDAAATAAELNAIILPSNEEPQYG